VLEGPQTSAGPSSDLLNCLQTKEGRYNWVEVSGLHLLARWVAVFLLLYGVAARADELLGHVVKRLASVRTFAIGPVGYAGVTSKGEIDFKFVLSQSAPVALAAFEKLYANGNPQAKSYALAGIRKLSPSRYKELLAIAGAATDEVEVMRGCVITHEPLQKVAKEIDGGEFRF
jgi:hypothetical protein